MLPISVGMGMGRARGARTAPAVTGPSRTAISMNAQSRPFQATGSGEALNSINSGASYAQPFMIPYGSPYVYTASYSTFPSYASYNPIYYQPVTYVPIQTVQPIQFQYYTKPTTNATNKFFRGNTLSSDSSALPANNAHGYATAAAELDRSADPDKLDVNMDVQGFHDGILKHLRTHNLCRVSWLNRMLAKCTTAEDFQMAKDVFELYHARVIETTPETGTLLIKAACRANVPERALEMLQDVARIRIWPTLGGIHYLMINFSLRKNTRAVIDTYEVTKLRHLKPTQRTYHILIRECVDNNLMEEAMHYANECIENQIVPNRVAYNILMNGCRKENNPKKILSLRQEMDKNQVEINDTTVKFTVLAHMMLGNPETALKEFTTLHGHPDFKLERYCNKFFDVVKEENSEAQARLVDQLFDMVISNGLEVPASALEKHAQLKQDLKDNKLGQAEEKAPSSTNAEGEATVEAKA